MVGFGVSDACEIVFDTLTTTRKARNLAADPRIALVIGWPRPRGDRADRGRGRLPDRRRAGARARGLFAAYPDGRDRLAWPGVTHARVRPTWVRFSDYTVDSPRIVEIGARDLDG